LLQIALNGDTKNNVVEEFYDFFIFSQGNGLFLQVVMILK